MLLRYATVAAATLLVLACQRAAPVQPDLLLITVDTLRADHLGCYGYPRPTTPEIDRWASTGVLFERAIASSSTTAPSHASLLTGLYPLQHGIRKNGVGPLRGTIPTAAELLAEAGYRTAAFTSIRGPFVAAGLDRGFETFDAPPSGEFDAVETTGRAAAWVEARRASGPPVPEPIFLWVHLFDPHSPYEQHPAGARLRAEPPRLDFLIRERGISLAPFGGSEEALLRLVDAYDHEIAHVDRALGGFLESWQRHPSGREAITILTADHGEGLGSHGYLLHGKHIYNEQVRVPLIVHSSAGRWPGRRIGETVRHVDLFATLLELAGTRTVAGPGHSLLSLLETGSDEGDPRWAFSERREFAAAPAVTGSPDPDRGDHGDDPLDRLIRAAVAENFESGDTFSLQGDRFKYVLRTEHPDEFYDLLEDPIEARNRIGEGLAAESRLRRELDAILRELTSSSPGPLDFDDSVRAELEALGYLP